MAVIRLERTDWVEAGLNALAIDGVAGLSIDKMCTRLKVTKGSFYHHFRNRGEYVAAILARWELEAVDEYIAEARPIGDPSERISRLCNRLIERVDLVFRELGVIRSSTDPGVAASLARVSRQRLSFLGETCAELGLAGDRARRAAAFLYSAYSGMLQLISACPDWLGDGDGLRRYIREVNGALIVAVKGWGRFGAPE